MLDFAGPGAALLCFVVPMTSWRTTMRSFVAACFVVIVIAVVAAAILDKAVQKSATTAFSTSAVRL
jgi:hypothetical protein